jgi:hypothetical protein
MELYRNIIKRSESYSEFDKSDFLRHVAIGNLSSVSDIRS